MFLYFCGKYNIWYPGTKREWYSYFRTILEPLVNECIYVFLVLFILRAFWIAHLGPTGPSLSEVFHRIPILRIKAQKTKTSSWKFRNKPKWLVFRMIPMFSGFPIPSRLGFWISWWGPEMQKIGCLQIPRVSNWFIGLWRPFFPQTAITSVIQNNLVFCLWFAWGGWNNWKRIQQNSPHIVVR